MKKRLLIASLMVLLSVALFSCGGGGGASGSSENTNINITPPQVTSDTNTIDVTTATTDKVTIDFFAEASNTSIDPFPGRVSRCEISYTPVEPGSPTISPLKSEPNCPIVDGDNTCAVDLIGFHGKQEYLGQPHDPITEYRVEGDCNYANKADKPGQLAHFDFNILLQEEALPLAVEPTAATIPADGTASATFTITGGTTPYTFDKTDPDNLVSATLEGAIITVVGTNNGPGSVTITVKDSSTPQLSVPVTVTLE